jgi:hypothetical protein
VSDGERLPAPEPELLARISAWDGDPLPNLTSERLRALTREHGIELATALLFERLRGSPPHADWNRRLAERLRDGTRELPALRATLAIVPGAFWREYPGTGVGGQVLEEPARRLGMPVERIPVASQGRLADNARTILAWLSRSRAEELVLVSLSKGSADVHTALALPGAAEAFARVRVWIDLSGIACGTPMVDWFRARPLRSLVLGAGLRLKGIDPRFLLDLAPAAPPALPAGLCVLRVAGFPLRHHCSSARSRRWWRRLAPLGPNDGVSCLGDLAALPATFLPFWGADHYLRPLVESSTTASALLATLAEDLS